MEAETPLVYYNAAQGMFVVLDGRQVFIEVSDKERARALFEAWKEIIEEAEHSGNSS